MAAFLVAGLLVLGPRAGAAGDAQGWAYLIDKLTTDGVPRAQAERVFEDPRVPPFDQLDFSLAPREAVSAYRGLLSRRSVSEARECFATHAGALRHFERELGVAGNVVAAILHVETRCGRNTGSELALWRLARLAMAAEPSNLRRNIARHTLLQDPWESVETQRAAEERARYLEATFYPEVRATFEVADRLHIDPLSIRGSSAGAFGLPQFLPTSYLRFAVDANGNGRVSLFEPDDAIASCANYLVGYGWRRGISRSEQRSVIWGYNHSEAYIEAVLTIADQVAEAGPLSD